MDYVKFFYWVAPNNIDSVLEDLKEKLDENDIPTSQTSQCEALNRTTTAMHVPPEVWSSNCKRQGSWFRTSERAKDHLVVLNQDLLIEQILQKGIIRIITVENYPIFPLDQIPALLSDPTFISRVPQEWFELSPTERTLFQDVINQYNLNVSIEEAVKMHSANHANFLLPRNQAASYCIYEGDSMVCSLFPQIFICSACMELFGILGKHHEWMIIKNCPGLGFVGLKRKEYFLVHHS